MDPLFLAITKKIEEQEKERSNKIESIRKQALKKKKQKRK